MPLRQTDADEYMLALKQEITGCMRELPYFVKAEIKSKDIERFSDRYREKKKQGLDWQPDWTLFPNELKIKVKRHRTPSNARPRIVKQIKKNSAGVEALKQLEEMVQKEVDNDKANDQEEEGTEGESGEEELEYDEEEQEEENDYLVSHFDDDEDAFMDDDDMDEGPIY